MIKISTENRVGRNILKIAKVAYGKHIVDIMLNRGQLETRS